MKDFRFDMGRGIVGLEASMLSGSQALCLASQSLVSLLWTAILHSKY